MPKLKKEPIAKADMLNYLDNYSDFSFELLVLKMLREYGIECEHGGLYEDPITAKSREFDIRAKRTIGQYRTRLAIECKNIREYFPILTYCTPRHEQESYHQIALVSEPQRDSSSIAQSINQSRAKVLSIRGEHSLYRTHELVGKNTVQVGKAFDSTILANDTELFEKWGQCLSSANDLVRRAYWDGNENDPEDRYFSAILPFVVVPNERLWMVSYDEDGNRADGPSLTDRCSCFINKDYEMGDKISSARIWLSHVEIVTVDGMRSFIKQHLLTEEGMERIFPKEGIRSAINGHT